MKNIDLKGEKILLKPIHKEENDTDPRNYRVL